MVMVKILLIDDDEDDYIITRDILEDIRDFNFTLDWKQNFSDGLERIKDKEHDICFVDYRLGESDGVELVKKAIEAGATEPLVVLTGKGDRVVDKKAMEEGAADFLVKTELTPSLMERCIRYSLKNSRALQMVKEGERKFRQLFERSVDAIYISDLSHQIIEVNPSFQLLFACDSQYPEKKKLDLFFEKKTEFEAFSEKLRDNDQVKDFNAELKRKGGGSITCQLTSIVRMDYNGVCIGYQGIIRDISLQKKAETELLMAQKLSMTGKIARSIAHEVRNPLTNLGLALDQLKDELPQGDEEVDMFLSIIERNANRIGQLITEMLNSSKPKVLHRQECQVNELLNDIVELVHDRLTLKGMKLIKNLSTDIKPLQIDADKLKIAILNVMVNAIEAMDDNAGKLHLTSSITDRNLMITIEDNGCGISAEDLDKLFDPFYTNKQGGMGLGLTSTQNIINSHGGKIEVSSKLDRGTKFILQLPINV